MSKHAFKNSDFSTCLHFFLPKGDSIHNLDSCGLVRFGILIVFGFENGMILGAVKAISKQQSSYLMLCGLYLVRRRLCRVRRWSSTSGGVFWLTESCECIRNANWPPWPSELIFVVSWEAADGGVLFPRSIASILGLKSTRMGWLPFHGLVMLLQRIC